MLSSEDWAEKNIYVAANLWVSKKFSSKVLLAPAPNHSRTLAPAPTLKPLHSTPRRIDDA